MAVIENLDIVLAANTSKIDAGFDYVGAAAKNLGGKLSGAAQSLAGFEPSLPLLGKASGLLAGLGPAALAAGAAIGAVAVTVGVVAKAFDVLQGKVREQFVEIDALGKAAGKIGIAADELAALRFAGEQFSGAQADQVDDAIKELRLRIAEAEMTGTGAAFDAMNQMGLNIGELAAMAPVEQFKAVAAAINESATAGERLFLAEEMMGDAGSVLMETLARGPEELQEAFDWAQKFGLALTDAQVQGVENMNASLDRVGMLFEGLANTIAVEIAPVITVIAKDLLTWIESGQGFSKTLKGMGLDMVALYGAGKDVLQILYGMSLFSTGNFTGVIDAYEGAQFEGAQKALADYQKELEAAAKQAGLNAPKPDTEGMSEAATQLQSEADKLSDRFADPSTKLQETIDKINQLGAEGLISDRTALQATQDALASFATDVAKFDVTGDVSDNLRLAITEIGEAFQAGLIDQTKADSITASLRETFGKSLEGLPVTTVVDELQAALDDMSIDQIQYDQLMKDLATPFTVRTAEEADTAAPEPPKEPPSFGALQAGSVDAYKQALANDRAANPQLSELKKQTAKQDQANAKLDAIIDNTANQFQMEGV